MATRTMVRIFDDRAHALQAVRDLEQAGFSQDEVSIMVSGDNDAAGTTTTVTDDTTTSSGAGTGATFGTLLGGGAGLLAGIGALAIPGVGPIVAAGWLVATLAGAGTGAVAGGLLGSLVGSGVDEREAHVYAEGVRRGSTLVSVRGTESRLAEAATILARHNGVDAATREADYRASGWSGYRDDSSLTSRDGTPGNPPGTEASRATDRTLGTNISGAYPGQSDGTMANPGGTAASRAANRAANRTDDGSILPHTPDGTPGNPRGTAVTRGFDEAMGTDVSGAHPENRTRSTDTIPSNPGARRYDASRATGSGSGQITPRADDDGHILPHQPDGAPGNPPGTEASRGVDKALGTNISGAHPENERTRRS